MYDLNDEDLENIQFCNTCNNPSPHFHFNSNRLKNPWSADLLFGLLVCANVPTPIQEFPLFSHLKPTSCNAFTGVCNRLPAGTNFGVEDRLCEGLKNPNQPKDFNVAVLIPLVKQLRKNPVDAVAGLRKQVINNNSVAGYYRALILAACYLKGVGVAASKIEALELLKEAVKIAEKIDHKHNHIFVINIAHALDFPAARECYYKIVLLRAAQILRSSTEGYFPLTEFFTRLDRDEKSAQTAEEKVTIQEYRLRAKQMELDFHTERMIQSLIFVSHDNYLGLYVPSLFDGLAGLLQEKNSISLTFKERLIQQLLSAASSAASEPSIATQWCIWHFRFSGSQSAAIVLAERALNGIFSSESNGKPDLVNAKKYYELAIIAAAQNLEFEEAAEILRKSSKSYPISVDVKLCVNTVIDSAIVALREQRKVDVRGLLNLISQLREGSERLVELFNAKPVADLWFEEFLRISIAGFEAGKKAALVQLLRSVTAYYKGNPPFQTVARAYSLLTMIALCNQYDAYFSYCWDDLESRNVHSEFVETLQREIRAHIILCVESNDLKALEEMNGRYKDYRFNANSSIPNYSQEVAYWLRRLPVNIEYLRDGLTNNAAGSVLDFCYANLDVKPPIFVLRKREELENIKHSEAYLKLLEADLAEIKNFISKNKPPEIQAKLLKIGKNLIKLLTSKFPADKLQIYYRSGVSKIAEIDVLMKSAELKPYVDILDFYYRFAVCITRPEEISEIYICPRSISLKLDMEESALNLIQDQALLIADNIKLKILNTLTTGLRYNANTKSDRARENDITNQAWTLRHALEAVVAARPMVPPAAAEPVVKVAPIVSSAPGPEKIVEDRGSSKNGIVGTNKVAAEAVTSTSCVSATAIHLIPTTSEDYRSSVEPEPRAEEVPAAQPIPIPVPVVVDDQSAEIQRLRRELADYKTQYNLLEGQARKLGEENNKLRKAHAENQGLLVEGNANLVAAKAEVAQLKKENHGLASELMKAKGELAAMDAKPEQLEQLTHIQVPYGSVVPAAASVPKPKQRFQI